MTADRKIKLFDGAIEWILHHLEYEDEIGYAETLEEIGFNEEEIEEILKEIFNDEVNTDD